MPDEDQSWHMIPAPRKKRSKPQDRDAIQRFFVRPFFLSCTIGIPFCIFKLLFGLTALRMAGPGGGSLGIFGLVVIVWASADLLMNTGRSALDLLHRPAPFEYCTIAQLGRIFGRPMIFLGIDTLLTFAIICAMLWTGWIATLSTAGGISLVWRYDYEPDQPLARIAL